LLHVTAVVALRYSGGVDAELLEFIRDARARTLELVADLDDRQLRVAELAIVNPLDWECGHVAHFQERFALRDVDGRAPLLARGDALYDSIAIPHDARWKLELPSRADLRAYLAAVRDGALAMADRDLDADARYRQLLAVFHEDMHDEAFTYTRQTMGYPPPALTLPSEAVAAAGPLPGDAMVQGGTFALGAARDGAGFVFDNEQWEHPVELAPYRIARAPVTQAELAAFVEDGGYRRRELWDDEGWRWRTEVDASAPLYWRRVADGWERRDFDRWVPLEPHRPAIHVAWHEAQAYCCWAGRRLPTEAEWEAAAAAEPDASGAIAQGKKRRYPWGDEPASRARANLDWRAMGCVDVAALPAGDSAFGCRQMIGTVWEWCADTFLPYPGFAPGPYREYSEPLFGSTKVLRGGCWVTRSRLIRNTWRNYYEPHRRDVWAGFRTAA
jgi:iron(II)-dependent oxidoreductase